MIIHNAVGYSKSLDLICFSEETFPISSLICSKSSYKSGSSAPQGVNVTATWFQNILLNNYRSWNEMSCTKTILVLGGAGVQNSAVARELVKNELFQVIILSRNTNSEECISLSKLPRVTLAKGDCYDENVLTAVLRGVDACFVNTNGFAIGEKAELYWAIRMYEIAYAAGVTHFVYSSLPYVSKRSGFNPKYRVPFADAKGRVGGKTPRLP